MLESLFDYSDYKKYLIDWITSRPKRGRGIKTSLAKAMSCPNSHVTQVLKGQNHLTLEQAEALTRFMSLTPEEAKFYLMLVQRQRAGTSGLRDFYDRQIRESIDRQFQFNTVQARSVRLNDLEDQVMMYNHWYFSAIHVAVSIPGMQDADSLSRELRVPKQKVLESLAFLESRGLIQREGARYQMGAQALHLDSTSPMIQKHHINWRLKAIESLDSLSKEDFHYSSVISVSEEDVVKIKTVLGRMIERIQNTVRPSEPQRLQCLAVDYYKLRK